MLIALVLSVWIAVGMPEGGPPQAGFFPSKAACVDAVAQVEAVWTKDGNSDGDMISGCYEIVLHEPALDV